MVTLSETERLYLLGKFTPSESNRRKLNSQIRRKAQKFIDGMVDFALVLRSEIMPSKLKDKLLAWQNYYFKILPLSQALYLECLPRVETHEKSVRALADMLEAAGISYDRKRLMNPDEVEYRLDFIMKASEWMRKNWPAYLGLETPRWLGTFVSQE